METNTLTMETSLVTAVTTKPASATPAASASTRPPASAAGPPTTASADPPPSASAGGEPSAPPPAAGSRSTLVGRNRRQTQDAAVSVPSPRILVFSSEEKKLSSLSPFQRKEGCDRFGKALRCDKLRDGSIEVEYATAADAAKALKATTFTYMVREGGEKRATSVPMVVAPHRTKNSTKGIITCFDLRGVSAEEITEGLSTYGVTHARRISSRRGGDIVPTDSIVLTFNGSDLPPAVVVGYVRVRVRAYIPNPMRCFRCQRFGHTRTHCNGKPACSKCASTDHPDQACDSDTLWCVNCGEGQTPHASYDRTCPKYAEEKEIITIRATRNISFREAREVYRESHPKVSYAQKVKTPPVPAQTSTSLTEMTATQLITLLRSFGLTVVASGATSERAVPPAPSEVSAPAARADAAHAANICPAHGGDEQGWTLVQPRRRSDRRSPPPNQATETSAQPRPPTVVDEALRRGEEERRAREAKRARLAQKARETRRSPGADSASAGSSGGASVTPETPQVTNPARMGPPPPPPLPQRRPAPPLPAATPVSRPPLAASTLSRQPQAPSGPGRPAKRAPPWAGSPTEGQKPRTRPKFPSGSSQHRSVSADARVHREVVGHSRIQFGESASSDAEEQV